MMKDLQNEIILCFKVQQNRLDFSFGFRVDVKVCLRPSLRVTTLEVLPHHDERHQEDLDHIREEQPQDKSGKGIESDAVGSQRVPAKPYHRPCEDHQKEAHGTHPLC